MTTDTGKHSALRQTSDGSFEIVYETGEVHPVHEEEPSFAETTGADVQRLIAQPPSRRTLGMVAVGAVALLATIVIVGLVVSDPGRASLESGEELPLVPGFKPYGGARADSNAAPNRARNRPAAVRAAAAAAERDQLDETEEEIVENELGWAVEEELPPDEVVEEIVEEEIVEEAVLEEEMPDDSAMARPSDEPVDPRMLRAPRDLAPKTLQRPIGADRIPTPQLPQVGAQGGMYQDRLNRLPIRQIQGDEQLDEGALDDELAAEDGMEGEVVDEEYVEEEVVEDY